MWAKSLSKFLRKVCISQSIWTIIWKYFYLDLTLDWYLYRILCSNPWAQSFLFKFFFFLSFLDLLLDRYWVSWTSHLLCLYFSLPLSYTFVLYSGSIFSILRNMIHQTPFSRPQWTPYSLLPGSFWSFSLIIMTLTMVIVDTNVIISNLSCVLEEIKYKPPFLSVFLLISHENIVSPSLGISLCNIGINYKLFYLPTHHEGCLSCC